MNGAKGFYNWSHLPSKNLCNFTSKISRKPVRYGHQRLNRMGDIESYFFNQHQLMVIQNKPCVVAKIPSHYIDNGRNVMLHNLFLSARLLRFMTVLVKRAALSKHENNTRQVQVINGNDQMFLIWKCIYELQNYFANVVSIPSTL